jgi:hypothetical protein
MRDKGTVVAAAIKSKVNGQVYSVPQPGRHHHVISKMAKEGLPLPIQGEQGFLLSDGSFVRRARAKMIAVRAGQLLPGVSGRSKLYSEDLW